jgi:hypothetical protein
MKILATSILLGMVLGGGLLSSAQTPNPDPAKTLFDYGVRAEREKRLDQAKLYMLTMARTYDVDQLLARAKVEIGAIYVFQEAQAQAATGRTHDAWDTYYMVIQVYPESALAGLAQEERKKLDPEGKWDRRR